MVVHHDKELGLKLTNTHIVGGARLNLVSMYQMKSEQIMEMIPLEQLQGTHGEARKDGPPPNHIW